EDNLYKQADFYAPFGLGGKNTPVMSAFLKLFKCPSDNEVDIVGGAWGKNWARGNYAANDGVGPMIFTNTRPFDPNRSVKVPGVFMINSKTRIADITDGTTFTALVSELIKSPGED